MFIVDFEDIEKPVILSKVKTPQIFSVHTFPVRDDMILLSLTAGVSVFNIENIREPKLVAEYVNSEWVENKIKTAELEMNEKYIYQI